MKEQLIKETIWVLVNSNINFEIQLIILVNNGKEFWYNGLTLSSNNFFKTSQIILKHSMAGWNVWNCCSNP